MINDVQQSQKSGSNSTNLQAQSITVNQGLSYNEVKEIALDVFKTNFLIFKQEAKEIAEKRAEEITAKFVEELKKRKPNSIEAVKDPGFQYALFEAQKNYAKTGDGYLADVLIDVLVDRVENTKRDLRQIVLDESVTVIPKLTAEQLDTLTVIFIMVYTKSSGIRNFETFKSYLESNIKPFIMNLSKEDSLYQHLEFAGCGSISVASRSIEGIFSVNYKGLFFRGFDKATFETQVGEFEKYGHITAQCLNDKNMLQINAIDEKELENEIKKSGFDDKISFKLKQLFQGHMLSSHQVKEKMLTYGGEYMRTLFDVWENSFMKNISLTSVGITIAQANFRRKTGISLDLSIWIK